MALFKISKGLSTNLMTNVPNAKEGFAYFTTDDGKFYIDIDGDGSNNTPAIIGNNRIPLNAYTSDILKATSMGTNDNVVYPLLTFKVKDSTKNLIEAKYGAIGIKNGTLVIPNVNNNDEILISNTGAGRGIVIDNTNGVGHAIEITAGKGIKVAKDPVDNLELATKQYVDKILSANDAMIFKGILDDTHKLPDTHETGWTYRVNKAGTYAGKACEIGDLVICTTDGLSANDAHWTVAQTNIDGAVIGPNTSTTNAVPTFADETGKVIKNNSAVTIDDTGLFTAPYIATGTNETNYFQSKKFRGEGNANTYYHAVDFGYAGHDRVDFHEYGGTWNFYKNTKGTADGGQLVASIKPDGFHGNLKGNADTATKVNNNLIIKLNSGTTEGTNQFTYNGSAIKNIDITPANIGAASSSHNHDSSYVKKSGDTMTGDLTAPTFHGELDGNADTATKFKDAQSITLTGDVTGTASSQAGWNITTTLSNSGVTNGTYGPTEDVNGSNGATISVPQITVDEKGRITNIVNRTYTSVNTDTNTTYSAGTGLSLSGTTINHSNTITAGSVGSAQSPSHGDTFAIPKITYDAQGHITEATTVNITLPVDYNTDTKVTTDAQTSSKIYVTGTPSTGTVTGTLQYNENVYISGNVMYGACWNDYAEYRISNCQEPGRVICENGDDTLSLATERLQPAGNVISDTFGFAIGETEQAKTPIAVSGRVLAYPYESREEFKKNIGRPVCSGPNGTVSIMTDKEYRDKSYCAIGTISAVPDYEEWGAGKVKVNGRVWIKVF